MTTNSCRIVGTMLTLAFCEAFVAPVLAMDPICNQLKVATAVLKTKPFHLYMTATSGFGNAKMEKAAGQLGMGGTKESEEISTGTAIYVMTGGKWIDMQTNFASMEEDKDADPDTKKAMEDSRCQALPDEVIDNQPALVYLQSVPALGIETKLWISKATHLPVRADVTNDQGSMKQITVSRYEYSGVAAPANAMTMKDMIKSRGGH